MRTKQEIFDTVVNHLHQQGKPAMNGEVCSYRADDGSMCAVGCLIPDEAYKPVFEGRTIDMFVHHEDLNLPPELAAYDEMLYSLQDVHDSWGMSESFNDIVNDLITVADNHYVVFNDPRK